jgi:hypothetical protein
MHGIVVGRMSIRGHVPARPAPDDQLSKGRLGRSIMGLRVSTSTATTMPAMRSLASATSCSIRRSISG